MSDADSAMLFLRDRGTGGHALPVGTWSTCSIKRKRRLLIQTDLKEKIFRQFLKSSTVILVTSCEA